MSYRRLISRAKGGVQRTPRFLERLFPRLLWGDPDPGSRRLFLTLDDGPDPNATLPLLDVLDRHGVPAAFFFQGDRLLLHPRVAERVREQGHLVGYHGLGHRPWWLAVPSCQRLEMDPAALPGEAHSLLQQPEGLLLRPPYGAFDPAVIGRASRMGARLVLFRLIVGDWLPGRTVPELHDALLRSLRGGDMFVLHDGGAGGLLLPELLDGVIPLLKHKGLRFGRLDELLEDRPG